MGTYLRVYSPAKTLLGELPQPQDLSSQVEHNAEGSISFTYPKNGVNAGLLDADDGYLAIVEDGKELPEWYLLEEDGDDDASDGGKARSIDVAGRGVLALLNRAVVWPETFTPGSPTDRVFTTWSPGKIMGKLLTEAQARGALAGMTWSFTDTKDSAGVTWPTQYAVTYESGIDLESVLTEMATNGWLDVRMVGADLRLYVTDTVCGIDRPNVILRIGKDVTSGPRRRSRRDVKTALLSVGNDGLRAEIKDDPSITRWGRREGLDQQGTVDDLGTLTAASTALLGTLKDASEGFTVEFLARPPAGITQIKPGVDFNVGDFIRYEKRRTSTTAFEPLRVRTIARSWTSDGQRSVSVELNDLFVENSIKLARKVAGIVNGAVSPTSAPPTPSKDLRPPAAPAGLAYSSAVYLDKGQWRGQVTVTWQQVRTNADGTPDDPVTQYNVSLRAASALSTNPNKWIFQKYSDDSTTAYISGLVPGSQWDAGIVAVDADGNVSVPGVLRNMLVATDGTPPVEPSAPILSTRMGSVTIAYDGKDKTGGGLPPDYSYTAVYRATSDGVTPAASTLVGRIFQAGGTLVDTGLIYNQTYWYRFVNYDEAGNASTASATASIAVKPLVDTDLIGQVLGYGNFKSGTVQAIIASSEFVVGLGQLSTDVQGTITSAGGKNQNYYSPSAPTPPLGGFHDGDLWFDTFTPATATRGGNKPSVWDHNANGGAGGWVAAPFGNAAVQNLDAGAITTGLLAAARVQIGSGTTFAAGYDPSVANGLTSAWTYTGTTNIDGGDIQADTVTAAQIRAGAITAEKVSVGAISDSVLLNPNFEDVSLADATLPAGWTRGTTDYPGPASNVALNTASPISGARSVDLKVVTPNATSQSGTIESVAFPVVAGETWYGRVMAKDSVSNADKTFLLRLIGGATPTAVTHNVSLVALQTITTAAAEYRGTGQIPAGMLYARLQVVNYGTSSTVAHTITIDGAEARKVVVSAQISDGAITAPKIGALEVKAGKIDANAVTADTIAAGAITADKFAAGTLNSNLVPDPSFEEAYAFGSKGTDGWRLHAQTGPTTDSSLARRKSYLAAHSGVSWASLYRLNGTSAIAMNSGSFPVVAGASYRVQVALAALNGNAKASVYLMTGPDIASVAALGTELQNQIVTRMSGHTSATSTLSDADYDTYVSDELIIPAGHTVGYVRIWNEVYVDPARTYDSTWLCVDDVSVIQMGYGATEITAAGLRLFGPEGTEVGAFVSNRTNYFTITDGVTGDTLSSINNQGDGSFQTLSIAGDDTNNDDAADSGLVVYGRDFTDWMWHMPWGVVSGAYAGTMSSGAVYTQYGLGEVSFTQLPGREYRVNFGGLHVIAGVAGARVLTKMIVTNDGTAPSITNGGTQDSAFVAVPATGGAAVTIPPMVAKGNFGPDNALIRVLITIEGVNAQNVGYNTYVSNSYAKPFRLWVEDIGPEAPDTYIANDGGGVLGSASGGTSAVPAPAAKKTYTKTWTSNYTWTYRSNNTLRTDTTDAVQGYNSFNGNGKAMIQFPSMTSTLSGATIKSMQVYLYANHWYYAAGGTAVLGTHGSTATSTAPSSPSGSYNVWTVGSWKPAQGRWVDVPSSLWAGFISGSNRGITLGPGSSNSGTYYGRFNGAGAASNKPLLKVTYVK